MTQEWKPEELRATAVEIRTAVLPKSITPEMVGGTLVGLIEGVEGVATDLSTKVDKVTGKGLSTNDFTTSMNTLLSNLGAVFGGSGKNVTQLSWDANFTADSYFTSGTYRISGQRLSTTDNLPIGNAGSWHTIEGMLYVFDSSITGTGASDDKTVTQLLVLSNRVGGQEGGMWMRSGHGSSQSALTWDAWAKMQTNTEVGVINDSMQLLNSAGVQTLNSELGLGSLVDNGIYSGAYIPGNGTSPGATTETFVMVVINNYALAGASKTITQVKFAAAVDGTFTFRQRQRKLGSTSWGEWTDAGGSVVNYGELGNMRSVPEVRAVADVLFSEYPEVGTIVVGTAAAPVPQVSGTSISEECNVMAKRVSVDCIEFDISGGDSYFSIVHKIIVRKLSSPNNTARVVNWSTYMHIVAPVTVTTDIKAYCAKYQSIFHCTIRVEFAYGNTVENYRFEVAGQPGRDGVEENVAGGNYIALYEESFNVGRFVGSDFIPSVLNRKMYLYSKGDDAWSDVVI